MRTLVERRFVVIRFDFLMKKWLRPSLMTMAVLALFASLLPSLIWACPVTGRTGTVNTVCNRSQDGSSVMSCCAKVEAHDANCMVQCCKSVPHPASNDGGNSIPARAHIDTAALVSQSLAAPVILITPAPPLAPLALEPLQTFAFGDSDVTPLLAQDAPSALAGRAPPLS